MSIPNSDANRRIEKLHELQVIMKVAERCNLACSYCYYFFMGDESYKDRDPLMKRDKFPVVVEYLRQGVVDLGIQSINIVFHGGEPTLLRARDFRVFVTQLREALQPICRLRLGMQTNGYHMSGEWQQLVSEFGISVGVSLDGPERLNDRFRVTHSGKGSYRNIAKTVARLHELEEEKKIDAIGALSVLTKDSPIEEIFDHFVKTMHFKHIGFLLPDRSWDDAFEEGESAEKYGDMLIKLFDKWLDAQEISVREVHKVLRYFQNYADSPPAIAEQDIFDKRTHVVVIQSTGEVNCDDSLIAALEWRKTQRSYSIFNSKVADFINDSSLRALDFARVDLPTVCNECKWVKICGGGALENRFSRSRQFDNPSVYCAGLKKYFEHIAKVLVESGYPDELIEEKLKPDGMRQPTFAI